MNIMFRTGSDEMDAAFVKAAGQNGIANLKGHRAVGGMRVSLYNAMPMVDCMREFEKHIPEL